jgi:F-box only protein C-terminal region
MYLDRPHVRHDGIYVSRNTYIKVPDHAQYLHQPGSTTGATLAKHMCKCSCSCCRMMLVAILGLEASIDCALQRGIVEWRVRNACHLVAYYRYYRFLANGSLLYRTSPEVKLEQPAV